ncbi:MAG: hypothetical protein ACLTYB_16830, partial [Clostridium paraputrificum]
MYSEDYLKSIRQNIYASRTLEEKSLFNKAFISLNTEGQELVLHMQDKEKKLFSKALGFEIGGLVENKKNEVFYVLSINDMGGMLNIRDISINLIPGTSCNSKEDYKKVFSIYDREVVKTRPLYG